MPVPLHLHIGKEQEGGEFRQLERDWSVDARESRAGAGGYILYNMEIGRFVLHRFNGDEIYRLKSAAIQLAQYEGRPRLTFAVETEEEAIQTSPDTADFPTTPNAEASVILDHFDKEHLVGRQFLVPTGYDEKFGDYVAMLYYYEHDDLNNNVIEVLDRDGDSFHVRWTATATDVNYYDGSKPDAKIVIEGLFVLQAAGL